MTAPSKPPTRARSREATVAVASDPWSIWFSRLIQIVGLGLVIFEALAEHSDRPVLLLVATAMMLGGVGLQMVLRWFLARFGG